MRPAVKSARYISVKAGELLSWSHVPAQFFNKKILNKYNHSVLRFCAHRNYDNYSETGVNSVLWPLPGLSEVSHMTKKSACDLLNHEVQAHQVQNPNKSVSHVLPEHRSSRQLLASLMRDSYRMTTVFEVPQNTPPSLFVDLLDSSLKASDLGNCKLPARVTASAASGAASISSAGSNGQGGSQADVAASDGTFTSFTGNDAGQLPPGVRVVHLQTVDPSQPPVHSGAVPSDASVGSPVNVTYTVNSSGQLHQVIQSHETVAAVLNGTAQQDGQRYAYYQGVAASDSVAPAGQFFVMMSPQDVIPVAASNVPRIAPRTQTLTSLVDGTFAVEVSDETLPVEFRKVGTTRSSRDERRRATHNEVERRRRDKISTWIMKLAAVVPDCQGDQSKQGTSKGGVLSKALDCIVKLRGQNERMADTIKEQERILVENQVLRQQVEKLRQESAILQASLQLHHSESVDEQKPSME